MDEEKETLKQIAYELLERYISVLNTPSYPKTYGFEVVRDAWTRRIEEAAKNEHTK